MPELPEVETVRRQLQIALAHQPQIAKVHLRRQRLRVDIPPELKSLLEGQCLVGFRRRAKYLLFDTKESTIISHLGMSGSWRMVASDESESLKHDHCDIIFENGQRLVFHDPRRFGLIDQVPRGGEAESRWLRELGPEPLEKGFSAEYGFQAARGRKVPIKVFLMDQKVVVGIGNIYASEVLFLAGVRPKRWAAKVTKAEWQALVRATKRVLQSAIQSGGSTIRDYRQASGQKGAFQSRLRVYGRQGEPCMKCKTVLKHQVLGGRATYWCPRCQK
jgi:formamidopyrimidine-DNA glycosylase